MARTPKTDTPKTPKARTPRPGGRPTALSKPIADAIVQAFTDGAGVTDAATIAGVSERTLQRWLAEGATKGGAHAALARRVRQARALVKVEAQRTIANAAKDRFVFPSDDDLRAMGVDPDDRSVEGMKHRKLSVRPKFVPGDWKAAKFFLQTRYPDEFAEPGRRVEVTGAGGGPVVAVEVPLDGANVEDLIRLAYGPGHLAAVVAASTTVQDDPDDVI